MTPKPINIDLILFDFDGTLTDSIPGAVKAIQAMLAELGLPPKTTAEILHHVGYGEVPLVQGAIGSDDPRRIAAAQKVYFKHYSRDGIENAPLYPHVKETLEIFKNKALVIISNKRDEFIRKIIAYHRLTPYFKAIFGGDSSPCLKPDPCTINKVLKEYRIPPRRALFVGDMTVDVETGKNAGIHTCAVTYGMDKRKELEKLDPDFILDDLLELKDLII
jgi:2-phosphoglycolate phosphatase